MTSGSDFIMAMYVKLLSSSSWSEPWNERGVWYSIMRLARFAPVLRFFNIVLKKGKKSFVLFGLTIYHLPFFFFFLIFPQVNEIVAMDLYKAKVPSQILQPLPPKKPNNQANNKTKTPNQTMIITKTNPQTLTGVEGKPPFH